MKRIIIALSIVVVWTLSTPQGWSAGEQKQYTVGVDDVLEISVLQPEPIVKIATVAPDGMISFPYIGNVLAKGLTTEALQTEIQAKLADGYMKYPVVTVVLKESRSRKFFVYGEVMKPGPYPLEEGTTLLKAISMSGGFTKYGSSSNVKILREKKRESGYEKIKVNIKAIMEGDTEEDLPLESGDIVVVSEGVF